MTSETLTIVLSLGLMTLSLLLALLLLLRHAASESRAFRRSLLEISILLASKNSTEFEQNMRTVAAPSPENTGQPEDFYYTGDRAYAEQLQRTEGALNDDELTSILGGI